MNEDKDLPGEHSRSCNFFRGNCSVFISKIRCWYARHFRKIGSSCSRDANLEVDMQKLRAQTYIAVYLQSTGDGEDGRDVFNEKPTLEEQSLVADTEANLSGNQVRWFPLSSIHHINWSGHHTYYPGWYSHQAFSRRSTEDCRKFQVYSEYVVIDNIPSLLFYRFTAYIAAMDIMII